MKGRLAKWVRIGKAVARDKRIPRPVRWLLVFGALPIPGPLDEAAVLIALGLIAVFWRPVLREVLADARDA
ncbi:MAG: hypothetical protein JO222_10680 [Frankiales bacterium]|nr:hypothetical protein [Frankiales bacterium]